MKIRLLPFEIFAVIHCFVILSLIYAPAPWLARLGGYSDRDFLVSIIAGSVLSFVGYMTAMVGWIKLETYLILTAVVGVSLVIYSLAFSRGEPGAYTAFMIYGTVLLVTGATCRLPKMQRAETTSRQIENIPRIERKRMEAQEQPIAKKVA